MFSDRKGNSLARTLKGRSYQFTYKLLSGLILDLVPFNLDYDGEMFRNLGHEGNSIKGERKTDLNGRGWMHPADLAFSL